MDSATSVSKGCFAYPGKRKRANEDNYLPSQDKFVKNRFNLYEEQWDLLKIKIDILKSELNCQIFDGLIQFLHCCHEERLEPDWHTVVGEIPTAVLITGVNTPDHGVMFSNLESILKTSVSPFIVRLLSKDCNKLNSLLKVLISQLTNVIIEDEDESEVIDEKNENLKNSPIKLKKVQNVGRKSVSMMSLVKWYKKTCSELPVQDTSKMKDASKTAVKRMTSKPLIVIVLEDVENIPGKVIQDFISICSTYLTDLPIVFVLGVATSVSALHQLLPSSVSSLLCMDIFQAPPASSYLSHLMDKIIMSADVPFKLGPKVFHLFLDNFLYHNFSVMNFTLGFQYCMLEHFLNNPLSLLCCGEQEVEKTVSDLTYSQVKYICKQDAFIRLVQSTPEVDKNVLSDDSATRSFLSTAISSFHTFHQEMFIMMRYLHSIVSSLPKYPLGKQFRELYSMCLKQNITETEDFTQALKLLQMMSRDDLTGILNQTLSILEEAKSFTPNMMSVYTTISGLMDRLKNLDEEQILKEEMQVESEKEQRVLPQRAKLHELKETLLSMTSKRRTSPYQRLREEILACLVNNFSTFLICPMNQPLQSVFYFNDLLSVKDCFRAAPRSSIQRGLTQPSKYLNCICCQCDSESILPSMPDICIVYKLHLECGTLVNLFDWMQAFTMVVTQNNEQNKKRKGWNKKPDTEYHARFIRAVSELQFLGFIKSTHRKTDHVAKLTW